MATRTIMFRRHSYLSGLWPQPFREVGLGMAKGKLAELSVELSLTGTMKTLQNSAPSALHLD